jgi:hypothetical protein
LALGDVDDDELSLPDADSTFLLFFFFFFLSAVKGMGNGVVPAFGTGVPVKVALGVDNISEGAPGVAEDALGVAGARCSLLVFTSGS